MKDQITRFQDPVSATPTVFASFTEWRPQPMIDLLQYVEKYDPFPPNFVGKMIEDGVCNKNVRGNLNSMDYVEKAALKTR